MTTYRAPSSGVWGWLAVAVGAAIAIIDVVSSGITGAGPGLGLGVAAIAVGIAAFLRPHVAIGTDRVEVHNVLATTTMPFARLERIDTRWTLELVGDDGRKAGAFAAPAPSASQSHRRRKDAERSGDEQARYGSPGDLPGTPSGDSALMVRQAWEAWRAAGGDDASSDSGASVAKRIDIVGAALVALAVAAGLWGLLG